MSHMFTKEEVAKVVLEALDKNPDASNPRRGSLCLYQKAEPCPGEAPRCVVGEVLHQLGLPVPPEIETRGALPILQYDTAYQGLFDNQTIDFLHEAQNRADSSLSWAAAKAKIMTELINND